jgi:hypothetical protein
MVKYNSSTQQVDPKQWIISQIPFSTKVQHYIALYNPILWWRATVMKKKGIHWNYNLLEMIVLYTVLPIFKTITKSNQSQMITSQQKDNELRTTDVIVSNDSYNNQSSKYWIVLIQKMWWIVPLLQSYLYYKTYRILYTIGTSMYEINQLRFVTHKNAYQCLYDRIQQQRAYRTYAYDIYLPPPPITSSSSSSSSTANTTRTTNEYILFLPGAYVEHIAYSEPASLLSDYGYIVIVLSSEPLGIVDMYLPPFTPSTIRHIQHTIEQQYNLPNDNDCNNNNNTSSSRWILMGHSMGSLTCTTLVSKLSNVNNIVMWGSAPFLDYMDDISQYTHEKNSDKTIRVLVVQGTNDDIIQLYSTPQSIQEFWNRLPKLSTSRYDIVGGTHHGFSNYITKTSFSNDTSSNLSTNEQHSIAVKATVDFLKIYD